MILNLGFIKSESQFILKTIDTSVSKVESLKLDTIEINEKALNLLFFSGQTPPEGLAGTLEKEEKFYPVLSADSLGIDADCFESLKLEELADIFSRVNSRWIMSNNIKTIENMFDLVARLRQLWNRDRSSFFEELWFTLKTNLASASLTCVFHDIREEVPGKNEKPSLSHSFVTGEKIPQIFEGGEKEEKIMKEYEQEFSENFDVTEFDSKAGKLVATVKIGLSPILMMAQVNSFNQLQSSILTGIFSGLQSSKEA